MTKLNSNQTQKVSFFYYYFVLFYAEMPLAVEEYVDLMPIEDCFGSMSSYRGTHNVTGQLFALRRLHDFRLSSTKCPTLIDNWKNLQHPNIVKLLQVFSTKAFGDNCMYPLF